MCGELVEPGSQTVHELFGRSPQELLYLCLRLVDQLPPHRILNASSARSPFCIPDGLLVCLLGLARQVQVQLLIFIPLKRF